MKIIGCIAVLLTLLGALILLVGIAYWEEELFNEEILFILMLGSAPFFCGLIVLNRLENFYQGGVISYVGIILIGISFLFLYPFFRLIIFGLSVSNQVFFWWLLIAVCTLFGGICSIKHGSRINATKRHQSSRKKDIHNHKLSSSLPGQKNYFSYYRKSSIQFSFQYIGDEIDFIYESYWQYPNWKVMLKTVYINGRQQGDIEDHPSIDGRSSIKYTSYAWYLESSREYIEGEDRNHREGQLSCTLLSEEKMVQQQCAVFPKQADHKNERMKSKPYNELIALVYFAMFVLCFFCLCTFFIYVLEMLDIMPHASELTSMDVFVRVVIMVFSFIVTCMVSIKFPGEKKPPLLPYIEVKSLISSARNDPAL